MPLVRATPPALLALELFLNAAWPERWVLVQGWTCRLGACGAIHLLDEPAWLALMFC
jgi:hypothetical protein